jgi:hypothetical protein
MRAPIIAAVLALSAAAAADAPKHEIKVTEVVQPALTPAQALGAAVEKGDPKAVAKLLHAPLEYTGMHGDDPACEQRFGDHGTVTRASDLTAFASCLIDAASKLRFVDHVDGDEDPVSQRAVDVYARGSVIVHIIVNAEGYDDDGDPDGVDGGEPNGVVGGVVGGVDTGPPPPPSSPQVVTPIDLDSHRISGQVKIVPDAKTRAAIAKAGKATVLASAKVCVDKGGAISSVTIVRPSGFPAYDDEIKVGILAWRFRPYLVNGVATPVCTAYMFVYAP